jgi:electron transport complex, RnfABCDGE type, D subunit
MSFAIAISPHGHSQKSTSSVMRWTLVALIPGIVAQYYIFGWGVLFQLLLTVGTALLSEAAILRLRGFAVRPSLRDSSAILTAALLAVAIPPLLPWWMPVVATAFAIIIAKQLYGGLGQNPFNPAMVGYVLLLVSFPVPMTTWLAPQTISAQHLSLQDTAAVIFHGTTPGGLNSYQLKTLVDGTTMATPLDHLKTESKRGYSIDVLIKSPDFSAISHDGWRLINLSFLAGGILLFILRLIPWQTPVAMLGTLAAASALGHYLAPAQFAMPEIELLSGASMLGAFFIVTDPVTSSTTTYGRLIFGALVGLLVFIIRHFGGYPDGVAFAVLLCNILVPLIDKYSQSRVYGH